MPQNRLGVATSVLTRADLINEPARTAGDALSRMPGVFMDATVGPDGRATFACAVVTKRSPR